MNESQKEKILEAVEKLQCHRRKLTKAQIRLEQQINTLLKLYKELLPIKLGDKVKVITSGPNKEPLERIGYVEDIHVGSQPTTYYVSWANKDGSRRSDGLMSYIVFEGSPTESIERLKD